MSLQNLNWRCHTQQNVHNPPLFLSEVIGLLYECQKFQVINTVADKLVKSLQKPLFFHSHQLTSLWFWLCWCSEEHRFPRFLLGAGCPVIKASTYPFGSWSSWFKPILVNLPLLLKKKKKSKKRLALFLEYPMTSCRHEVPTCMWNGRAARKMTSATWVVFSTWEISDCQVISLRL